MLRFIILGLMIFCMGTHAYSMDQIRLVPEFSANNYRYSYEYALLKKAFDVTADTDGPYIISHVDTKMSRNRVLYEFAETDSVNVHAAATRQEWEFRAIPIRIPIFRGLLGYRLFLINKDDEPMFTQVQKVEDLKQLKAGLVEQWTTTSVLKRAHFKVVTAMEYDSLFKMLEIKRFDYFPRGVPEIFGELKNMRIAFPGLSVEPTLALYFPTPCYFFVSPKHPKLADRLKRGMEKLVQTGVLESMFLEEYGEHIDRANLKGRKLLKIENPLLSNKTPFNRLELWFTP
ncbi:hypothetical protein OAN24_05335 [Pseudodesulfovibrio sp.]|nr:hypothetical protein [Pseudodesulfovibrio sp.]